MKFFISVGEPSGDVLGAELVEAYWSKALKVKVLVSLGLGLRKHLFKPLPLSTSFQ